MSGQVTSLIQSAVMGEAPCPYASSYLQDLGEQLRKSCKQGNALIGLALPFLLEQRRGAVKRATCSASP